MKLAPVTKLDKGDKTMAKRFDNDVMSANCNIIVIFPIYSQLGAIRKTDSGRAVCKSYIFIDRNLFPYKN